MKKNDNKRHILFSICNFYFEIWAALLINIIMIYRVFLLLQKINVNHNFDFIPNINKLIWFPLIWILVWTFSSVNTILLYFNISSFILHCFHLFFASLIGFFNALLYGYNKSLVSLIKKKLFCTDNIDFLSESESPQRSFLKDDYILSILWNSNPEKD